MSLLRGWGSGASLINSPLLSSVGNPGTGENSLKENYTFLFQGDYITNGNRTRDNDWNHLMGEHGGQINLFIIQRVERRYLREHGECPLLTVVKSFMRHGLWIFGIIFSQNIILHFL
ncbi:MAG: hypothetical protein M3Z01_06925 [Thermoproteota archaeon]|nr:hypothetical protein [Thermoproteota archaeon]